MLVEFVHFTNLAYAYTIIDYSLQVTGKALMLDEIINYVQSLQRQVEVINSSPISIDLNYEM